MGTARKLVSIGVATGVIATGGVLVSNSADAAISCSTTQGGSEVYPGPSASKMYNTTFRESSIKVPYLTKRTPQGVAVWPKWRGSSDLLLITAYKSGSDAYIMGIDRATGKHIGTVAIADSHVGGIAVSNGWAFVSGRSSTIRKYKLSELKTKMLQAGIPYLKQTGEARKVYASSFLSSYGGYLYAGSFKENDRGKMYRYRINSNGSLTTMAGSWEIPKKTQGLMVTAKHFVYSTSYGRGNRSNIYVVKRGQTDLDRAKLKCFRAPSMSEGIASGGDNAYLVYESGSSAYPGALNPIKKVHVASVSKLTGLVP